MFLRPLFLVLLASCQSPSESLVMVERVLVFEAGQSAHLVLEINAAALAQADAGLLLIARGAASGDARLQVVPDDPRLEELVVEEAHPQATGETFLDARLLGGDLSELCPGPSCEIGVTLTFVARATSEPTTVLLHYGVARSADRPSSGGEPTFDEDAAVSLRAE